MTAMRRCLLAYASLGIGALVSTQIGFRKLHHLPLRDGALAVVVGGLHETPHQEWENTDFPSPMRQSDARLRLACTPLVWRSGASHERDAGGGSDPRLLTASAASGRVSCFTSYFTVNPPLRGPPSTVIPADFLGMIHNVFNMNSLNTLFRFCFPIRSTALNWMSMDRSDGERTHRQGDC